MADKFYLNNRLKYHTASRVANQTSDSLAATFNVDGHIVRDSSVWTAPLSSFPLQSNNKNADPIGATEDLVTVFKEGATSVDFWNGGKVWSNEKYPAVKLYENVTLTPVGASLGPNKETGKGAYYHSYEILASAEDGYSNAGDSNVRVTEWVAPPAIIDPDNGKPVAGYTGLQMLNGTTLQKYSGCTADTAWGLGGGHWEFVYMAGILTFEVGCTPQEIGAKKTTGLTLTAFKYVGDKLDKTVNNINNSMLSVQPFTWQADNEAMASVYQQVIVEAGANVEGLFKVVDGKYVATDADEVAVEGKEYFEYVGKEIIIPAIVFNVFNAATGIAYGDIKYLEGEESGKTRVMFEDWNDSMFGGEKTFVAYGFVYPNNNRINVLATSNLNKAKSQE